MNNLLSTKDIAKFIGYSEKSVRERIVTNQTFPKPIRIPSLVGNRLTSGCMRWEPEEVRQWIQQHRG